ncbi:MAG: hypothetical protein HUJ61_03930 [Bacilli bacterium]|nr:hypothetical protein [Bacilli bacterium]
MYSNNPYNNNGLGVNNHTSVLGQNVLNPDGSPHIQIEQQPSKKDGGDQ